MAVTVAAYKLRRLLVRRQMTQADLAREFAVKRNTVTYWLQGRAPRRFDTVKRLVEWSGGYITADDFAAPLRRNAIYPEPPAPPAKIQTEPN
jgi:transcriptional regulator with XRE-family HTH domain